MERTDKKRWVRGAIGGSRKWLPPSQSESFHPSLGSFHPSLSERLPAFAPSQSLRPIPAYHPSFHPSLSPMFSYNIPIIPIFTRTHIRGVEYLGSHTRFVSLVTHTQCQISLSERVFEKAKKTGITGMEPLTY